MNNGVDYEIIRHIGVLHIYQTGWQKEINLVRWNEGPVKYDIRDWSPEHDMMSRGITLSIEECHKLGKLLRKDMNI